MSYSAGKQCLYWSHASCSRWDSERPSAFVNVCCEFAAEQWRDSQFPGEQARRNVQKRMGPSPGKKTNAGNEINTPCRAAAVLWLNVKPYRPRSLAAVSKSKQNGNGIKPIFVLLSFSAQGLQQRLRSKCSNHVFYWTGINCCFCNNILC